MSNAKLRRGLSPQEPSWSLKQSTIIQALVMMSLCFAISQEASAQEEIDQGERLYLRYQGTLDELGEEPPDSIDCIFSILDSDGMEVWSEPHDVIYVIERHFSVSLGTDEPLYSSLFDRPLRLRVACHLDADAELDVDVIEQIGTSPRAAVALRAQGEIDATSIKVNGAEVINSEGIWVGTPPVANRVQIGEQDLISPEGAWLGQVQGQIVPVDRDGDSVPDLFEELLGTDPDDPSDTPLDADENGRLDVFDPAPIPPPSVAEEAISNLFTSQRVSDTFFEDPQTIAEWIATTINFNERGGIVALEVSYTLTHSIDTRALEVILVSSDGARFTLLSPRVAEGEAVTEESFSFNQATPPVDLDWSQVLNREDGPRELSGTWSLLLRDDLGEGVGAVATVSSFTMEATYQSGDIITLSRDLDLAGVRQIIGVPDPTFADHVVNKSYVDAQISLAQDDVSDLRGEVNLSQQETRDLINQNADDLEEARTALSAQIDEARLDPDLSYPEVFTYRARTFETYDVSTSSYLFGDNGDLFAGVSPSAWSAGATADQVNLNKLSGFLRTQSQGGSNALISMQTFESRADEEGLILLLHFQVENTSEAVVSWPLEFSYSCNEGRVTAPQRSSLALNTALLWSSEGISCDSLSQTAQVTLDLPPGELSEIVIAIAGSTPQPLVLDPNEPNPIQRRRVMFAFTGECLTLPESLRFRRTWE